MDSEQISMPLFLTRVLRRGIGPHPWVVIGNFDGCHVGHQKLFEVAVTQSHGHALGITFFPHPREALHQHKVLYIDTLFTRVRKMVDFGLAQVWVVHFTPEFSQMGWESFCETVFVNQGFVPRGVCVGEDFKFGHDRHGSPQHLKLWLQRRQVDCQIIENVTLGGKRVSSEWVRQSILSGDFETAAESLKSAYVIAGVVQPGPQLGHQLGFPTANVYPAKHQLLPPFGVYMATTRLEGRQLPSVINVGVRPTIDPTSREVVVESHVLDFHETIYGKCVSIEFLQRIRAEEKFPNLEALKAQIQKDVARTREYFERRS